MRIIRGLALGLMVIGLMGMITTASQAQDKGTDRVPTVGEFLSSYAKTLNLELPASADPVTVREVLRASGVKVDASLDLAKPLTQADVVSIGKANGLHVTTRNPVKSFTARETEQFFLSYGTVLGRSSNVSLRPVSFGPNQSRYAGANARKAKSKKGKKHHSPNEPDDHDNGDGHDDGNGR